jgi:hypothetical protein
MMAEAADDCLQLVISFRVVESRGGVARAFRTLVDRMPGSLQR